MCVSQSMMRVSEPVLDMDMANYSEVLDPTYTTLEFETMQILYNSNGEFSSACKYNYKLSLLGEEKLSFLGGSPVFHCWKIQGLLFKATNLSFCTLSQNLN